MSIRLSRTRPLHASLVGSGAIAVVLLGRHPLQARSTVEARANEDPVGAAGLDAPPGSTTEVEGYAFRRRRRHIGSSAGERPSSLPEEPR